jgi:diacylglycerol kinase
MNNFLKSIKYAINGWKQFLSKEKNGQIQIVLAGFVIAINILIGTSPIPFAIIILCCALVIAAEMINTCIEKICNKIEPQYDEQIKIIKDISAGAVLLISITSVIVAAFIIYDSIINSKAF